MKKLIIPLLMVLTSLPSYAQKAKLTVIDPDIDASELSRDFEINSPSPKKTFLPDRQERDDYFKGITAIKKWDELQKDIFFLDLQTKDLSLLAKKYPDLSAKELKTLKAGVSK